MTPARTAHSAPVATVFLDYSAVGLANVFRIRCRPALRQSLRVADLVTVEGDGVADATARVVSVERHRELVEFEFVNADPTT